MTFLAWDYAGPGAEVLGLVDLLCDGKPATPWLVVIHEGHDSGARVRLKRRGDAVALEARDRRGQLGYLESEHLAEHWEDLPPGEESGESPRWRLWCEGCEGDEARNVEPMLSDVLGVLVRWRTGGGMSTPRLLWS